MYNWTIIILIITTNYRNYYYNTNFSIGHLTTLPVSKLFGVDDRIINECGAVGGVRIGRGNHSTTSSTTNPTWLGLGSNPDRRGWKSTTKSLSYGTAYYYYYYVPVEHASSCITTLPDIFTAWGCSPCLQCACADRVCMFLRAVTMSI
jgi:hypothetical protein